MNRPPRSAWLALAFALATVPTASFAEEALGRLFLTPEKRDLLDRQRALNSLENQTLEEPQILINGQEVTIQNPRDARAQNIETIYQTLALADNLDASSNLFLGRELKRHGLVDDATMEAETRKIMGRLNPNFRKFNVPVSALSGGQRQSVAIARAVYFNAKILIMDEPTAALGPHETQMVSELIQELKAQGLGIFLIEHDIHNVMKLCDRASVMKNGQLVGTVNVNEVTDEDILGMIILGKKPAKAA